MVEKMESMHFHLGYLADCRVKRYYYENYVIIHFRTHYEDRDECDIQENDMGSSEN
jgi:hypothetical protein